MSKIIQRIRLIINNHELLFKLAAKEIKVRYKHPILGFLWALIVPFCMIIVFKLIFSLILKISFPDYPFFIFLTTAVFPWNFFSLSISNSSLCIQENSTLIKKVYFPREIIPISIVFANLINFLLTLLVIFPIFIFFRISFTPLIVFLPLVITLQIILTVGISLIFSSLQARFRDVKYVVEILLLLWFYLTPIFYPLTLVAGISRTFFNIYMLNPLAKIITLYRLTLLKGFAGTLPAELNLSYLISSTVIISVILFFFGFWFFRKIEPDFADLV